MDDKLRAAERLGPGELAGEPELMGAWVRNLERTGQLRFGLDTFTDRDGILSALGSAHHYHGTTDPKEVEWVWGRLVPGDYAEEAVDALGRRKSDGKWISVTGSCDTTGWDCQSGADESEHVDVAEAVAFLSQEARAELLRQLTFREV